MHVVAVGDGGSGAGPVRLVDLCVVQTVQGLGQLADLLPHTWTLNNYREIFTRAHFLDAAQNSIIAAVSVTVATLLTSAAVGYVFAITVSGGKICCSSSCCRR